MRRQRETTRRAEQADRDRAGKDFLAMIAHELRGPLNAVLGWTQILRSAKLAEGEVERALETIERNASAQIALVEDLIEFSRLQTRGFALHLRPTDLALVVRSAVESLRPAAAIKKVELEARFPAVPPVIQADPERLQQVVLNLLTNAVKFTQWGGRVEVCLSTRAETIELTVHDNGAGIPPESLARIFERQKGLSNASGKGGLGLGLGIVRRIVDLHGGTVHAASVGAGHGATFTVVLPRNAGRPARAAPPGPEPHEVSPEQEAVGGVAAANGQPDAAGASYDDLHDLLSDRELTSYRRFLLKSFRRSCLAERETPTGFRTASGLHTRLRGADAELRRRAAAGPAPHL